MSRILPLAEAVDVVCVGGKAANLGELIRAGFNVPNGFVIPTCASPAKDQDVIAAYECMGRATVAVRSSAAAEDGATASMAGQFETVLNVNGDEALLAAVRHCLASAASDRVRAYEAKHGLTPSVARMAVVVQRQAAADVAGVLFTADPTEPYPRQMRVEASWGLGESVVSGDVRPDRIHIDFHTGRVLSTVVADKHSEITAAGKSNVNAARRSQCCLSEADIAKLWKVGRKIEAHFGRPQDVEWAIAAGELYVLQSRPVTTITDPAAVEEIVAEARRQLHNATKNGCGPWVLHNLAETLPHPTPLTWSVIQRFMSADGGFGRAYAKIGFEPSGDWLDLIAGRIYQDTSRSVTLFGRDLPLAYDAEAIRRNPEAAQQSPDIIGGTLRSRLRAGKLFQAAAGKLPSQWTTSSMIWPSTSPHRNGCALANSAATTLLPYGNATRRWSGRMWRARKWHVACGRGIRWKSCNRFWPSTYGNRTRRLWRVSFRPAVKATSRSWPTRTCTPSAGAKTASKNGWPATVTVA